MKLNIRFTLILVIVLTTPQVHADDFEDGVKAYLNGDYLSSYQKFKALALKGDAGAQSNLGMIYEMGKGITQNYEQAVKIYGLSALQGFAPAQYKLGLMYAIGRGVAQDFQKAVKWYKQSVEYGHAPAQSNLGVMYTKGYGVTKDYVEALKWFYLAAKNGSDIGRNRLILENQMTPDQIAQSERLANEWRKKYSDE